MLSPRILVLGVAFATLVAVAAPASSQQKPQRTAPRIEIPFHPTAPITAEVDLRPEIEKFGLAIRDQGNRSTCSVFATTFLIEFHDSRANKLKNLDLSEEYLNWAKNRANKSDSDGGFFTDIIKGYQQFGMVPIGDMPYLPAFHPKNPDTPRPRVIVTGKTFARYPITFIKQWDNQKGMSEQELEAAKAALRAGHPVATGIWWLENFETVTVDHVPLLKEYPRSANTGSNPPMFDGHSIDLVGFHEGKEFPGGGYFIFRNSFGPNFGHNGYGFVSFKYLRNYSNDAIVIGK
jgi:hypothetical protein